METYVQKFMDTKRIRTAYYRAGEENRQKLLLLHGNLSSSVFFLPLMPALSHWFDVVIPDLRCFGDSEDAPVDATRGYRDWSDDIHALVEELGWERFGLCGWSMGGDVAMQYAIDHTERLEGLVLIAPGSPYGFGGTKGEEGRPLYPVGLGSGGGTLNPELLKALTQQGIGPLRQLLYSFYFTPNFHLSWEWERKLIRGIGKTKLGSDRYPGDFHVSVHWPFISAGKHGVLNTMSPAYGNLSGITEIKPKPPILWIRGRDDVVVSDHSMLELGNLGSIGMVPGWPGEWLYPPQPMVSQTRHVLERYREKGGVFHELVIPGGHACHLESPAYFVPMLCSFLLNEPLETDAPEGEWSR